MPTGTLTISQYTAAPTSEIDVDSLLEVRGWYNRSFISIDGVTPVFGNTSGGMEGPYYFSTTPSLNASGGLVVPAHVVQITVGANPTGNYFEGLWIDGAFSQMLMPNNNVTSGWQIPSVYGDPIAYDEIATYNRAKRLVYPPDTYFTADQVIQEIERLAGNFDYMAVGVNGIGRASFPPVVVSEPIVLMENDPRVGSWRNILSDFASTTNTAAQNTVAITNSIAAATIAGGGIYIPVGTFPINNVSITVPIMFAPGASILRPATGQTVILTKSITADFSKHFDNALSGQGSITFASGDAEFKVKASPTWWGGDATGVLDSAPAINAAIESGAKYIDMQGLWKLGSPILLTKQFVVFDGNNALVSEIYAAGADISTGVYPNALIVNLNAASNATITNLRFTSSGAAFTGWCISAVNGGSGGAERPVFSMRFLNNWVDLGTSAAGFLDGGSVDSFFSTIQFENMKVRFNFRGSGVNTAANIFSNINELHCYDPLIKVDVTGTAHNFTVSNITADDAHRGFLFDLTNVDGFIANNVTYTNFDDTGQPTFIGGLLSATGATNIILNGFFTNPATSGNVKGVFVDGSQVKASNGIMTSDSTSVDFYPLDIDGSASDVSLSHIQITGARRQVVVENAASGRLVIDNCILERSVGEAIASLGAGNAMDVTVQNSQVIDASYGPSGVATSMIDFTSSGRFVLQNNHAIGRTDIVNSATTYLYNFMGAGQLVEGGNNIVGVGATGSGENNPGGTQVVTYIGNNPGGTSNRSRPTSPLAATAVVPLFIGEEFLQTTGNHWFKAHGLTNTDWTALN